MVNESNSVRVPVLTLSMLFSRGVLEAKPACFCYFFISTSFVMYLQRYITALFAHGFMGSCAFVIVRLGANQTLQASEAS